MSCAPLVLPPHSAQTQGLPACLTPALSTAALTQSRDDLQIFFRLAQRAVRVALLNRMGQSVVSPFMQRAVSERGGHNGRRRNCNRSSRSRRSRLARVKGPPSPLWLPTQRRIIVLSTWAARTQLLAHSGHTSAPLHLKTPAVLPSSGPRPPSLWRPPHPHQAFLSPSPSVARPFHLRGTPVPQSWEPLVFPLSLFLI